MKKILFCFIILLLIYNYSTSQNLPQLSRVANENNFFDITGRRIFFVGYENGSGELWSPPYQLLSDLIILDEDNKRLIPLKYKITPAFSEIIYDKFTLTYYPHYNKPLFIIKIAKRKNSGTIRFRLASILRANWPVENNLLNEIETKVEKIGSYNALSYERKNQQKVLISSDVKNNIEAEENNYYEITLNMSDVDNAHLVIASDKAANKAASLLLTGLEIPNELLEDSTNLNLKNIKTLPSFKFFGINKDSKKIEESIKWAMIGADKTYIETPEVGSGYVAGFNISEKIAGSGAIPPNNGRPGFAWYFGRDFLWMSFALSMLNQWDKVKNNFLLLKKYQRDDGKIMHELPTSVEIMGRKQWEKDRYFYAAADSTPLYIIALRNYLDASGDINFIKEIYPSISKAFDYMIKTDYDGDGLIDNHEGHGWVEGGPLAENQIAKGHTTFYLASLYIKALEDMEYLAFMLKDESRHSMALSLIDGARIALEAYWNEEGFYNHRKYPDGSYGENLTIAPTVGFIFNVTDPNKALINLNNVNGPDIVTPWGARFISEYDPLYDPTLYHAGNVWPLFSGWLSLANYNYGLKDDGYYLLMTILKNTYDNALGYISEVFRGDIYENVGCPHQGWSETMGVWSFLTGLLGMQFDALNNRLYLSPSFPEGITKAKIKNLHIGDHNLDFIISKNKDKYTVIKKNNFNNTKIILKKDK